MQSLRHQQLTSTRQTSQWCGGRRYTVHVSRGLLLGVCRVYCADHMCACTLALNSLMRIKITALNSLSFHYSFSFYWQRVMQLYVSVKPLVSDMAWLGSFLTWRSVDSSTYL